MFCAKTSSDEHTTWWKTLLLEELSLIYCPPQRPFRLKLAGVYSGSESILNFH